MLTAKCHCGAVEVTVPRKPRNVYWNEPDGHQREMLTASYARQKR